MAYNLFIDANNSKIHLMFIRMVNFFKNGIMVYE